MYYLHIKYLALRLQRTSCGRTMVKIKMVSSDTWSNTDFGIFFILYHMILHIHSVIYICENRWCDTRKNIFSCHKIVPPEYPQNTLPPPTLWHGTVHKISLVTIYHTLQHSTQGVEDRRDDSVKRLPPRAEHATFLCFLKSMIWLYRRQSDTPRNTHCSLHWLP